MENRVRVLLVGAEGRLGQAIARAAESDERVTIAASCGRGDAIKPATDQCNVVLDVSAAAAISAVCDACIRHQKPLVIGTTGHSPEELAVIHSAATAIPIVLAPNFSVGVNALFWLARKAAELLGDDFDIEIVEAHHRLKKDAPSGTAKRLAELLSAVRGLRYEEDVVHGREGVAGERPSRQIGVHAIRGGEIVGDHTVMFSGKGERLELIHRASSRDTFALGALRAARWILDRPPQLYSMEHVLGLAEVA